MRNAVSVGLIYFYRNISWEFQAFFDQFVRTIFMPNLCKYINGLITWKTKKPNKLAYINIYTSFAVFKLIFAIAILM